MTLVSILLSLIILGILIYAVYLIVGMLPIPQPIKTLVWLLVAVVFLIVLLNMLGISSVGGGIPLK